MGEDGSTSIDWPELSVVVSDLESVLSISVMAPVSFCFVLFRSVLFCFVLFCFVLFCSVQTS